MYEDATELQVFFVAQRDILCKDGQIFLSPALNYTKRMLLNQIEDEKKTKQNSEENDDEKAGSDEVKKQSTIDDILVTIAFFPLTYSTKPHFHIVSECYVRLRGKVTIVADRRSTRQ